MRTTRMTALLLPLVGGALSLFVAPAASAPGKSYPTLVQRYGGVLAPECANYLLPQLKYLGDSLVVQDGGKAVLTGRKVKASPTYFGATPPPDFEMALTSQVAGGDALVFIFYRNADGLFAAVEGGPKTMAALPDAFNGKRARHCDPNRNAAPGKPATVEMSPVTLLKDENFKRPYVEALGPLAREDWLMRLDGPAPPVRKMLVAGTDYYLVSACKNHDCAENNIVLLYAAPASTIYAKVYQRGRSTIIGAPPPPVAVELERLWKAEFRKAK